MNNKQTTETWRKDYPLPWAVRCISSATYVINDSHGIEIRHIIFKSKEMAEFIVASVNACRGFNLGALSDGVLDEVIKGATEYIKYEGTLVDLTKDPSVLEEALVKLEGEEKPCKAS